MKKYITKTEPFAVGYLECDAEYTGKKIACGLLELAKHAEISFDTSNFFVGKIIGTYAANFTYGDGIAVDKSIFDEKIESFPQYADELKQIKHLMLPIDTRSVCNSCLSEEERLMGPRNVGWAGESYFGWGGHSNPDYGMLLSLGTNGMKEKISACRKNNPGHDEFYDAAEIAIEALEIFFDRYRKLSQEMLAQESGKNRELILRLVRAFENIPRNPPRDFFEACQCFWLEFYFGGVDSPGRFDQYMIDFYRRSDEKDRRLCLEKLWQLFQDNRAWNLCISGSDEDMQDKTNELSIAILETARKFCYNTPNLTVRVHRNTPELLWQEIAKTIATGIGMPAIYNDEVVCPALEALGIPQHDSHMYCMNGCNQIDIFGKSHMGLEDGELNLAKCVALTLTDGYCTFHKAHIGIKTGDPTGFECFEEFLNAYKKRVEYFTDKLTAMANRSQELFAKLAPNPFRSNLIIGCLESGRDMRAHGPLYNNAQILMEGVADAVDSLAAIKRLVYDEKRYTMAELVDALSKNFENCNDLYRDFSNCCKFGTENDEADAIFKDITEHFSKYLLSKNAWRGGVYGAGCSPFSRAASYGISTGPLPNGKKADSALFADSFGAVPGCDKKGVTALLNSVLKYDHKLAKSGLVLQLKFDKNVFETQNGISSFIALAKTYMARGGQQLAVNVVSANDLLEARKYPEKYKTLVVRVGGYSAYFNDLTPELQENIIARTLI